MKQTTLSIPEVGMIAATRGMVGAGAGLLLAGKLSPEKRKAIGLPLLVIGALSTIPIVINAIKKIRDAPSGA